MAVPITIAIAGTISAYHKIALAVVAACSSYRIDKALGIAVDGIVGGFCNCRICSPPLLQTQNRHLLTHCIFQEASLPPICRSLFSLYSCINLGNNLTY